MLEIEAYIINVLLWYKGEINSIRFLKSYMFKDKFLGEIYKRFEDDENTDAGLINANIPVIEGITEEEARIRLSELMKTSYPDRTILKKYAKEVLNAYIARKANEMVSALNINASNVADGIADLMEQLDGLQSLMLSKSGVAVAEWARENQGNYPKERGRRGISLGIEKLDDYLDGIEGGDLCYIGARPSVGKSAFVSQVIRNLDRDGLRIGFFSLEMNRDSIGERFLASEAKVSMKRIRGGEKMEVWEEEALDRGFERLQEMKNVILYTDSVTVGDIRQIVRNDRLQVVVVDYVQIMKADGRYAGNRVAEVGAISHGLKQIAMDFNIPMILLSQLNRAVELRDDKEPTLADIRESGDIEQDASQVIFLWNKSGDKDNRKEKGCYIAKNRHGALGRCDLWFDGTTMTFTDEAPGDGWKVAPKDVDGDYREMPFV